MNIPSNRKARAVTYPPDPIKNWVIVIGGFLQSKGRTHGNALLWRSLRGFSDRHTCVQLHAWDDDWDECARKIKINSEENPNIVILAYSWGAGHGFTTLARRLGKMGLGVAEAVLCDPVYRPRLWSLGWLALLRSWKVKVPVNVSEVTWLTQYVNRPGGHGVVMGLRYGHSPEPIVLELRHTQMDDSEEYHVAAHRAVRKVVGYKKQTNGNNNRSGTSRGKDRTARK